MRVAIDLVKSGEAAACVSAGNTGALMATGRFVLKTIDGIDRPAIISRIRARHGHTHMLDLGANSERSEERRVGKECRSRGARCHRKQNEKKEVRLGQLEDRE